MPDVDIWEARAAGYRELARSQPLFATLAARLVAALPSTFSGTLADVGGGFGLVTTLALETRPLARAVVLDPAAAMRALAREETSRFGARVEVVDAPADAWPARRFDAAIASGLLHLVDAASTFAAAERALAPGAPFLFNLWGHAFEETRGDRDVGPIWKTAVNDAIAELGLSFRIAEATPRRPRRRSRAEIIEAARAAGLVVRSLEIDEDAVPIAFHLAYAATAPSFLPRAPPALRARIIAVAADRLAGACSPVTSVRFALEKPAGER